MAWSAMYARVYHRYRRWCTGVAGKRGYCDLEFIVDVKYPGMLNCFLRLCWDFMLMCMLEKCTESLSKSVGLRSDSCDQLHISFKTYTISRSNTERETPRAWGHCVKTPNQESRWKTQSGSCTTGQSWDIRADGHRVAYALVTLTRQWLGRSLMSVRFAQFSGTSSR